MGKNLAFVTTAVGFLGIVGSGAVNGIVAGAGSGVMIAGGILLAIGAYGLIKKTKV